jgi:hypothetical protein
VCVHVCTYTFILCPLIGVCACLCILILILCPHARKQTIGQALAIASIQVLCPCLSVCLPAYFSYSAYMQDLNMYACIEVCACMCVRVCMCVHLHRSLSLSLYLARARSLSHPPPPPSSPFPLSLALCACVCGSMSAFCSHTSLRCSHTSIRAHDSNTERAGTACGGSRKSHGRRHLTSYLCPQS